MVRALSYSGFVASTNICPYQPRFGHQSAGVAHRGITNRDIPMLLRLLFALPLVFLAPIVAQPARENPPVAKEPAPAASGISEDILSGFRFRNVGPALFSVFRGGF